MSLGDHASKGISYHYHLSDHMQRLSSIGLMAGLLVLSYVIAIHPTTIVTDASAEEGINSQAVAMLNQFIKALMLDDSQERLRAVLPFVHKSMLSPDGNDLDRTVKEFSYKRAVQNVKFYQVPVKITRVAMGNVRTIGFKSTAERGRVDRYFVAKRSGVAGLPAPIHIFFPENGGVPKIINMGSL